MLFQEVYLKEQ